MVFQRIKVYLKLPGWKYMKIIEVMQDGLR